MKKLLLSLGSITSIVAPVAMVVSCGNSSEKYYTVPRTLAANMATELKAKLNIVPVTTADPIFETTYLMFSDKHFEMYINQSGTIEGKKVRKNDKIRFAYKKRTDGDYDITEMHIYPFHSQVEETKLALTKVISAKSINDLLPYKEERKFEVNLTATSRNQFDLTITVSGGKLGNKNLLDEMINKIMGEHNARYINKIVINYDDGSPQTATFDLTQFDKYGTPSAQSLETSMPNSLEDYSSARQSLRMVFSSDQALITYLKQFSPEI